MSEAMKKKRATYSQEHQLQLVRKFETTAASIDGIVFCKEHGIHGSMVRRWRENFALKYTRGDPRNLSLLDKMQDQPGTQVARVGLNGRALSARNLDPALRAKAIELYEAGQHTVKEIATEIGIPEKHAAVSYWIVAHRKNGGAAKSVTAPVPEAGGGANLKAAISLLRQMDKEVMRLIRQNKIQSPDSAHMLGMMALRALTGDQ